MLLAPLGSSVAGINSKLMNSSVVGETGFEPATPWSRKAEGPFTPVSIGSQNLQLLANTEEEQDVTLQPIAEDASTQRFFTTPLLRRSGVRTLGPNELLRVAEVARLLGLCRATIYRLIERGALPAFRIRNSIRLHPKELSERLSSLRNNR